MKFECLQMKSFQILHLTYLCSNVIHFLIIFILAWIIYACTKYIFSSMHVLNGTVVCVCVGRGSKHLLLILEKVIAEKSYKYQVIRNKVYF